MTICAITASYGPKTGGASLAGLSVPSDIKARILSTHIDLDDGTCSLDLLEAASGYFKLSLEQARSIIRDVATVTATWRNVAKAAGARGSGISRMASAFEHTELRRALRL